MEVILTPPRDHSESFQGKSKVPLVTCGAHNLLHLAPFLISLGAGCKRRVFAADERPLSRGLLLVDSMVLWVREELAEDDKHLLVILRWKGHSKLM